MKDIVTIYKDTAGEWRWNRRTPNGNIIADSGEGYDNKSDAIAMAQRVNTSHNDGLEVVIEDDK